MATRSYLLMRLCFFWVLFQRAELDFEFYHSMWRPLLKIDVSLIVKF